MKLFKKKKEIEALPDQGKVEKKMKDLAQNYPGNVFASSLDASYQENTIGKWSHIRSFETKEQAKEQMDRRGKPYIIVD